MGEACLLLTSSRPLLLARVAHEAAAEEGTPPKLSIQICPRSPL